MTAPAAIACLDRGLDYYEDGLAGMAIKLGVSKELLRKEMEGGPSHKLGLVRGVQMARHLSAKHGEHCYDFAAHVAEECGGQFVVGGCHAAPARGPVEKISLLMRETSDVTTTVLDSMADGIITDNELVRIEHEIAQAEEVLRKLRRAARAVNLAHKPAAVQESIRAAA